MLKFLSEFGFTCGFFIKLGLIFILVVAAILKMMIISTNLRDNKPHFKNRLRRLKDKQKKHKEKTVQFNV